MRKLGRIALWTLAVLAALAVLASIAGVLIVRSDRFHQYIQRRIVEEVQRATGGRVELGGYSLDWHNLTAQVQQLVIHGKESPAEPPLLQVGSATLSLRIISVLEKRSISRLCASSGLRRILWSTPTVPPIFRGHRPGPIKSGRKNC
jgi:uncharacterized protein YhdP